jgi:hypothetical protein
MSTVPGDPRRRDAKATDLDRARVVELLRAHWAEGQMSSRDLDERMGRAYAVTSLAELDALVSGLEGTVRLSADVLLTHGLTTTRFKRERSFLERQLIYSACFFALWVVILLATGASLLWYVLTLVGTATGFAFRLARGDRARSGLLGAGSRKSISR